MGKTYWLEVAADSGVVALTYTEDTYSGGHMRMGLVPGTSLFNRYGFLYNVDLNPYNDLHPGIDDRRLFIEPVIEFTRDLCFLVSMYTNDTHVEGNDIATGTAQATPGDPLVQLSAPVVGQYFRPSWPILDFVNVSIDQATWDAERACNATWIFTLKENGNVLATAEYTFDRPYAETRGVACASFETGGFSTTAILGYHTNDLPLAEWQVGHRYSIEASRPDGESGNVTILASSGAHYQPPYPGGTGECAFTMDADGTLLGNHTTSDLVFLAQVAAEDDDETSITAEYSYNMLATSERFIFSGADGDRWLEANVVVEPDVRVRTNPRYATYDDHGSIYWYDSDGDGRNYEVGFVFTSHSKANVDKDGNPAPVAVGFFIDYNGNQRFDDDDSFFKTTWLSEWEEYNPFILEQAEREYWDEYTSQFTGEFWFQFILDVIMGILMNLATQGSSQAVRMVANMVWGILKGAMDVAAALAEASEYDYARAVTISRREEWGDTYTGDFYTPAFPYSNLPVAAGGPAGPVWLALPRMSFEVAFLGPLSHENWLEDFWGASFGAVDQLNLWQSGFLRLLEDQRIPDKDERITEQAFSGVLGGLGAVPIRLQMWAELANEHGASNFLVQGITPEYMRHVLHAGFNMYEVPDAEAAIKRAIDETFGVDLDVRIVPVMGTDGKVYYNYAVERGGSLPVSLGATHPATVAAAELGGQAAGSGGLSSFVEGALLPLRWYRVGGGGTFGGFFGIGGIDTGGIEITWGDALDPTRTCSSLQDGGGFFDYVPVPIPVSIPYLLDYNIACLASAYETARSDYTEFGLAAQLIDAGLELVATMAAVGATTGANAYSGNLATGFIQGFISGLIDEIFTEAMVRAIASIAWSIFDEVVLEGAFHFDENDKAWAYYEVIKDSILEEIGEGLSDFGGQAGPRVDTRQARVRLATREQQYIATLYTRITSGSERVATRNLEALVTHMHARGETGEAVTRAVELALASTRCRFIQAMRESSSLARALARAGVNAETITTISRDLQVRAESKDIEEVVHEALDFGDNLDVQYAISEASRLILSVNPDISLRDAHAYIENRLRNTVIDGEPLLPPGKTIEFDRCSFTFPSGTSFSFAMLERRGLTYKDVAKGRGMISWVDPDKKITDLTADDLRNPEEFTKVGKAFQGRAYDHTINSEAELNDLLKKIGIQTSTGARYHGQGVRYATGLFEAVIDRFFERTGDLDRPFKLRQEYINIIENGGTIIDFVDPTQPAFTISKENGRQNFDGFLIRYGLEFRTRKSTQQTKYTGNIELGNVDSLGKQYYTIKEVTPEFLTSIDAMGFLEAHPEMSMTSLIRLLYATGSLGKAYLAQITRLGELDAKSEAGIIGGFTGGQGEADFWERTVNSEANPEYKKRYDSVDGAESDCLTSNRDPGGNYDTSTSHQIKAGDLAVPNFRDGVFKNLFGDLYCLSKECMRKDGKPSYRQTIFHCSPQSDDAWHRTMVEMTYGMRLQAGQREAAGETPVTDPEKYQLIETATQKAIFATFDEASSTLTILWRLADGQHVLATIKKVSDDGTTARFEVRRKVGTVDETKPMSAGSVTWIDGADGHSPIYDSSAAATYVTFMQDMGSSRIYNDLSKQLLDWAKEAQKGQRMTYSRADLEGWLATAGQRAPLLAFLERQFGEGVAPDAIFDGVLMYRYFVQVAMRLLGKDAVLSPDLLSRMFGRFIKATDATKLNQFKKALEYFKMGPSPLRFASILGRAYIGKGGDVFALPGVVTQAMMDSVQDTITQRERMAAAIASAIAGSDFTQHVKGQWAGAASVDDVLSYFEARLRDIKAFVPVDLHDTMSSTPVAKIVATLRQALEGLGLAAGTPLTGESGGRMVLTEAGRLVLRAWLEAWRVMVFDQVLEPSAFKVGQDPKTEAEARRGREEQWAKMLMKSYMERRWLVDQRDVSIGALIGVLQPIMVRECARVQFMAYAWGAGFRTGAMRYVRGWTYVKITWGWTHAAGPREFLVRFRTDGDLLRSGFQVFATWNAADQHFYSSIPLAEIDTRLAVLDESAASEAVMDALRPWTFANRGDVPLWFADLLDPPTRNVPPGYPGMAP
nr:hypothetical protein [Candidatus Sigynarchaeum springense]